MIILKEIRFIFDHTIVRSIQKQEGGRSFKPITFRRGRGQVITTKLRFAPRIIKLSVGSVGVYLDMGGAGKWHYTVCIVIWSWLNCSTGCLIVKRVILNGSEG